MTVSPISGPSNNQVNFSGLFYRKPSPVNNVHLQSTIAEAIINDIFDRAIEEEAASLLPVGIANINDGVRAINSSDLTRLRSSLPGLGSLSRVAQAQHFMNTKTQLAGVGIDTSGVNSFEHLGRYLTDIYQHNKTLPEHYWRFKDSPYKLLKIDPHANLSTDQVRIHSQRVLKAQFNQLKKLQNQGKMDTQTYRDALVVFNQLREAKKYLINSKIDSGTGTTKRNFYDARVAANQPNKLRSSAKQIGVASTLGGLAAAATKGGALLMGPLVTVPAMPIAVTLKVAAIMGTLATVPVMPIAAITTALPYVLCRGAKKHNGLVNYGKSFFRPTLNRARGLFRLLS